MARMPAPPRADPSPAPRAPKPRGKPQPQPPRLGWWWIILTTLLVWNLFTFVGLRKSEEAPIPYSTFLAQIAAGNVTRVEIVGDRIRGTFAEPVPWPPPDAEKAPGEEETRAAPAPEPRSYTKFRTALPEAVGDPRLLPLLAEHGVVVDVKTPTAPWFVEVLASWMPLLLLVGVFWWMGRQAAKQQSGMFGFGRTKARRYTSDRPEVTFADVAGADEAKADLMEEVDFLRNPKKYHALGARIPRGVLLVGPPGTGKTLLARAVAGEAGVPFFSLSASEFVEMFVGVGASRVRDLFAQAKAAAPAIVFIDELDAVGRRRGAGVGAVNDEREQTLNQLLVEMDGFDDRQEVIVLAATNRPDVLDPALLRPGRFDRRIEVPLPDRHGREGILRIHTRKLRLAADVDLPRLARLTVGFSGADLANLSNEATLLAARRNRADVSMAEFVEAQDKVLLGGVRKLALGDRERRIVAYHEAGHAVVAWLTPAADPVRRVTIVPHGRALGVTQQLPGEDRYNYARSYLLARLAVMLGGRAAEELALEDVTTGAENDLVEATQLARRMVTRWGMGELGLVAFRSDDQHPFLGYDLSMGRDYSEATAAQIDRDVQRLLDDRHAYARRLLAEHRDRLERLVDTLLREESLDEPQLQEILGPRPTPARGEPAPRAVRQVS